MRPNLNLMKATLTGALGGLLFGFDTVVISGTIDSVVKLYGLSDYGKGLDGRHRAYWHRGRFVRRGSRRATSWVRRETLRLTAVLYVVVGVG